MKEEKFKKLKQKYDKICSDKLELFWLFCRRNNISPIEDYDFGRFQNEATIHSTFTEIGGKEYFVSPYCNVKIPRICAKFEDRRDDPIEDKESGLIYLHYGRCIEFLRYIIKRSEKCGSEALFEWLFYGNIMAILLLLSSYLLLTILNILWRADRNYIFRCIFKYI